MSLAWTEEGRNNRKREGEAFGPNMLQHQAARGQCVTFVNMIACYENRSTVEKAEAGVWRGGQRVHAEVRLSLTQDI